MNNVPSSAVLAIVAVVAAVAIASLIFVVTNQQTQSAQHTEAQVEAQQQENYDAFIGARMDGEAVKSFIKVHQNDKIAITVDGSTFKTLDGKADTSQAKLNTIVSGAMYDCDQTVNDTGAVVEIRFTRE